MSTIPSVDPHAPSDSKLYQVDWTRVLRKLGGSGASYTIGSTTWVRAPTDGTTLDDQSQSTTVAQTRLVLTAAAEYTLSCVMIPAENTELRFTKSMKIRCEPT